MSVTIEERVRKLVADVLDVPVHQLTATAPLNQLERWDSFNLVNLLIALEGEFQISVSPEEAGELTSIEAIAQILRNKGVR